MDINCSHLDQIKDVSPLSPNECQECVQVGDEWVHLRMCMTCGHIGCCDDSKNKHASLHAHEKEHPIIQSFEDGEDWMWCYIDQIEFSPFDLY